MRSRGAVGAARGGAERAEWRAGAPACRGFRCAVGGGWGSGVKADRALPDIFCAALRDAETAGTPVPCPYGCPYGDARPRAGAPDPGRKSRIRGGIGLPRIGRYSIGRAPGTGPATCAGNSVRYGNFAVRHQ
ncbi:hypothetical protein GCM10010286_17540 [Streptomyces toxytricini]|nr:hypothetical protein GCM10010286_17540 [Streptomyces toxytricini]